MGFVFTVNKLEKSPLNEKEKNNNNKEPLIFQLLLYLKTNRAQEWGRGELGAVNGGAQDGLCQKAQTHHRSFIQLPTITCKSSQVETTLSKTDPTYDGPNQLNDGRESSHLVLRVPLLQNCNQPTNQPNQQPESLGERCASLQLILENRQKDFVYLRKNSDQNWLVTLDISDCWNEYEESAALFLA